MISPIFALIVTLVIQILASVAIMTAPILAPEAAPSLLVQATKVGVFVSIAYVAAMISSLFSGYLIDLYGALRTSQLSLLACAAGMFVAAWGTIPSLVLAAILLGAGYGPITPASSHILIRTTPENRLGLFFSLKQTGVPIGGALAGLLLPLLVLYWQWRHAAIIVGVLCLLGALACQWVRSGLDSANTTRPSLNLHSIIGPFFAVMRLPNVRRIAFCTIFYSVAQLCLTTYIVTYLTTELAFSLTTAGILVFFIQGSGVAGRILWGMVADRWLTPMMTLSALGFTTATCSLLMAAISPHWGLWLITLITMIFGASAIGWNGVYLAEIARLSPKGQAGLITGGTLFFTYFGVVVGPPAFAWIVESSQSFSMAYAVLGVLIAIVATLLTYFQTKSAAP